jgi:hypothetical protein
LAIAASLDLHRAQDAAQGRIERILVDCSSIAW